MSSFIYLDNSTLARPSEKTISRMIPFLTNLWGTPSAPHQKGQELFPILKESYQALYRLLGAKQEDLILFTSSGAEAVNHVITSVHRDVTLTTGKNQFITTSIEEAPAILSMGRLEQYHCVIKIAQSNKEGIITPESIADLISPRTALVSMSWANGMTGVIQPIAQIAEICKQRGVLFHLDATHILGKLFFTLEEIGPDFISFNGDQLHAPKGTGALYIRAGVKCSPFIIGGSDQGSFRAGSLNVPALVALGNAADEAIEARDLICTEVARLRRRLEYGIEREVPGAFPRFSEQERIPNCTTIAFPGIINEALLFLLNRKGVYASMGGGNFQQIGLLLMASGIEEMIAHSALSFSLSRYTTEDEIDRAVAIIGECAKQLQMIARQIPEEIL